MELIKEFEEFLMYECECGVAVYTEDGQSIVTTGEKILSFCQCLFITKIKKIEYEEYKIIVNDTVLILIPV